MKSGSGEKVTQTQILCVEKKPMFLLFFFPLGSEVLKPDTTHKAVFARHFSLPAKHKARAPSKTSPYSLGIKLCLQVRMPACSLF